MEFELNLSLPGKSDEAAGDKKNKSFIDIAIVGGGPSGLTAAIYGARARYRTVIFEKMAHGGLMTTTEWVENYPGFPEGISGFELAEKMEKQATQFGAEIEYSEITKIEVMENKLKRITAGDEVFFAKAVIFSTGTTLRKLDVPGEKEYSGRGVSYCATCDGAFFKDKIITVIGGGDSAVEEGTFLTKFGKKVYIVHRRSELRASKIVQERAFRNDKIEFIWDSVVEEIKGDRTVESVILKNLKTGELKEHRTDGIFVFVGQIPNSQLLRELGAELDENGFVKTDDSLSTSLPGIFAAGDVRSKFQLQIATAVGEGALAEKAAEKYIENNYKE